MLLTQRCACGRRRSLPTNRERDAPEVPAETRHWAEVLARTSFFLFSFSFFFSFPLSRFPFPLPGFKEEPLAVQLFLQESQTRSSSQLQEIKAVLALGIGNLEPLGGQNEKGNFRQFVF